MPEYTERLVHTVLSAGARVTGRAATLTCKILRVSDLYGLDWNDWTFKASGWTTLAQAATEVDSTNFPGVYYWIIGASATIDHLLPAAFSDDEYSIEISDTGIDYNQSHRQFVRLRRMWDMAAIQLVHNKKNLAEGASGNYVIYEDDGSTALLTRSVKDKDGGAIVLAVGIPAKEE